MDPVQILLVLCSDLRPDTQQCASRSTSITASIKFHHGSITLSSQTRSEVIQMAQSEKIFLIWIMKYTCRNLWYKHITAEVTCQPPSAAKPPTLSWFSLSKYFGGISKMNGVWLLLPIFIFIRTHRHSILFILRKFKEA